MNLSGAQIRRFEQDGFLLLPNLFSAREVELMRAALIPAFAETTPANIREKMSGEVRTAMGYDKINLHAGSFGTYAAEIYMRRHGEHARTAYLTSLVTLADRVPLYHARSAQAGLDQLFKECDQDAACHAAYPRLREHGPAAATLDTTSTSYPLWVVDRTTVSRLVEANGIVSATGPAGTALIFGDCLVHASPPNLSPWGRRIFSLIANPIANAQRCFRRPDYMHHRDFSPLEPLDDNCLLAAAA